MGAGGQPGDNRETHGAHGETRHPTADTGAIARETGRTHASLGHTEHTHIDTHMDTHIPSHITLKRL